MIRHSLFFCVMFVSALCMAKSPDISSIRANYNLVPIVDYTPSYFNRAIDNAFKFDGSKQCFFVSKKSDKSILWYNDFSQKGSMPSLTFQIALRNCHQSLAKPRFYPTVYSYSTPSPHIHTNLYLNMYSISE